MQSKLVGIIAAMKEELEALIALISEHRQTSETSRYHISSPILEWHQGRMQTEEHSTEIVALQSGVGKAQAAMHTSLLLQRYAVDYIVNIGSAGSLMHSGHHGDIVIADSVAYYDADVRPFGYDYGQLPGCPAQFPTSVALRRKALKSASKFFAANCPQLKGPGIKDHGNQAVIGQIVSGDSFITSQNPYLAKIQQHFPQALAVEMEAAAIAQVAFAYGCPCLIVRSISDFPLGTQGSQGSQGSMGPNSNGGNNNRGKMDFQQYLPLAAANAAKIVKMVICN